MCRGGSVPRAIEDLSHNLTLSLLSSDLFSNRTGADVTVLRPTNYYKYDWHNLLYAYLTATLLSLACVGVGARSYALNGYSASSSFSSIMFTTRSPELDVLARGQCLGAQTMPSDLRKTLLQYGLLQPRADGEMPHAAFSLRGTVTGLRKGDICY